MMAKVSVKGGDITPLYAFLTDKTANPVNRRRNRVELYEVSDRPGWKSDRAI